MVGGPDGFITKTYLQLSTFFLEARPPELLWLKLMSKLLLAMLHHYVTVCAALDHAMEKSDSLLSGQELTEWTGLSNSIPMVFHSANVTSLNNITARS